MVVARWRAHGILRALVLTWRLPCQVDHVWRDVGILLGIAAVFKLLFCVLFFRKTTSMSEPRVPTASEQLSMHKMTGGSVHAPLVVGTAFGQNLPPFVQVMN